MLSKQDYFQLYCQEKDDILGPKDLRELANQEFPSFKDWYTEVKAEHLQTHVTVDVSEADRLANLAIAESENLA